MVPDGDIIRVFEIMKVSEKFIFVDSWRRKF